jgi:hypothetical protein
MREHKVYGLCVKVCAGLFQLPVLLLYEEQEELCAVFTHYPATSSPASHANQLAFTFGSVRLNAVRTPSIVAIGDLQRSGRNTMQRRCSTTNTSGLYRPIHTE